MFWSTLLKTLTSNGPFQVQVFLNGCFRCKMRLIWQLRGPSWVCIACENVLRLEFASQRESADLMISPSWLQVFGKFFRHIRPINCLPDLTSSSSKLCANLFEKLSRISNCIESQNSSANEEKWEKNPFLEIAETENCFFFYSNTMRPIFPNLWQNLTAAAGLFGNGAPDMRIVM